MHAAARLAHRALRLGMATVADHHDLVALVQHLLHLDMHLGHQRAGGVEDAQPAPVRFGLHRLRHAVRAEDHGAAGRHLIQLLDEHRALRAQALDHIAVVHDLVAHVDRRAVQLERALDDLDRALDAGAKAPGIGEQHFHHRRFSHRGRRAYASSNAASRRGWAPRSPSITCLAQSKYSCRRARSHLAGGRSATSRRLTSLSASLTSFASWLMVGACSICRRFLSALGSCWSSVTSATMRAMREPKASTSSWCVVAVSSTVSCNRAAHSTSVSVTPPSFTNTSASAIGWLM